MLENLLATCGERQDEWILTDPRRTASRRELLDEVLGIATCFRETGSRKPIALLVERSVTSVAAMFAAMWAGRAFVPLDADDPEDRLSAVLDRIGDCDVLDATGQVDIAATLGVSTSRIIDISALPTGLRPFDPVPMAEDDLEFLIFTSGSTGVPKGVPRRVGEMEPVYDSWVADTFVQRVPSAVFAPLHFLAGFTTVMRSCSVARQTILIDPRTVAPLAVRDLVVQHGIARLNVTPSFGRVLAQGLGENRLEGLREVRTVGEAPTWDDLALIRSIAPNARICSGYGASEVLGGITRFVLEPHEPIGDGRVSLGHLREPESVRLDPIDDERAELVVRGAVAEGYWNDPELTAARFGVDDDGVRFWRSGDIVAVRPDGQLEHCGRVDDMLKVNGILVEPAEAERVLRSIPGVRGAVVLARTVPSGREQFVGHVEADETVSVIAVRSELQRQLPAHLVPPILVRHDTMPLTNRGKVDRQLLRSMRPVPWRTESVAAPYDELTLAVMGIAAMVTGLEEIGADDDLWDLGLDSLAAIELTARLDAALTGSVQPNDLIELRTPRAVARALASKVLPRHSTVVRLSQGRAGDPPVKHLHLIAGGGGPAVQYLPVAMALGSDWAVTLYEQQGLHQRRFPDVTVEANAKRHLRSLRELQPSGPYVLAGHSWGGLVAHRMAVDLEAFDEQVTLVLLDTVPGGDCDDVADRVDTVNYPERRGPGVGLRNGLVLLRRLCRPAGHLDRYRAFYNIAAWSGRRYRPPTISSRVVLLHPAASRSLERWSAQHRNLEARVVPGDHNSMLMPPAVETTAAQIRDALTERTAVAPRNGSRRQPMSRSTST